MIIHIITSIFCVMGGSHALHVVLWATHNFFLCSVYPCFLDLCSSDFGSGSTSDCSALQRLLLFFQQLLVGQLSLQLFHTPALFLHLVIDNTDRVVEDLKCDTVLRCQIMVRCHTMHVHLYIVLEKVYSYSAAVYHHNKKCQEPE